jgi:organic radical activating enzyme
MKVNEIFGPTVQGEGSAAGRHCMFVRMALCNLECTWCDTAYTWAFTPEKAAKTESGIVYDRAANVHEMNADQVIASLCSLWPMRSGPRTIVVFSGGEPMIQGEAIAPLAGQLRSWNHEIHIETAGTLLPPWQLDNVATQYNVSPKLKHSGNAVSKRYKPDVLAWYAKNCKSWFKFVLRDPKDLAEIDSIVFEAGMDPRRVMIMPEGVTAGENLDRAQEMATAVINRGYGISLRTHILLWKDVRGK